MSNNPSYNGIGSPSKTVIRTTRKETGSKVTISKETESKVTTQRPTPSTPSPRGHA